MNQIHSLFAAALGLTEPWQVVETSFSLSEKRLEIRIVFRRGGKFPCLVCGESAAAYDTAEETWRHLNFFQYATYLTARVPRIECRHCGVKKVEVPWARSGSGFTLLFEALVLQLASEMPVAAIAAVVGEHDTRLWRVIHHYVDEARARADYSEVRAVGVDETASRRGHTYISLFADVEQKRILFGTSGKEAATVAAFVEDLGLHGANHKQIEEVACDLSPAFIKGVKEELPQAKVTFDRFHLMTIVNRAVDQVRREEAKQDSRLKQTRYLWLKNEENLTGKQQSDLAALKKMRFKTGRAYQLKETFQEFFEQKDGESGEKFLQKWYWWASHSRLKPMQKVGRTIKEHWDGIMNWFSSRLTTGLMEGFNSLLQAAKARARGYRSDRNLIAMAYLLGGKLDFHLPT
jgi:transposase